VTSIFATAMGDDFGRLHPMMQKRFGVGLDGGYGCEGTGVMTRIRRGPWWTVPFLYIGKIRNILVPTHGDDVPFTIENFPYRDPLGRETVTFVREMGTGKSRGRFDATMVLGSGEPSARVCGNAGSTLKAGQPRIVDYLGSHQHLAVDLELTAGEDGSLHLRSGAQRFYEGPIAFRFPMQFSGRAELTESFDDAAGVFRIRMEVHNRVFGFLFGYEGVFRCEFPEAADAPHHLKPVRHERRE
jgi:hypothetical protein